MPSRSSVYLFSHPNYSSQFGRPQTWLWYRLELLDSFRRLAKIVIRIGPVFDVFSFLDMEGGGDSKIVSRLSRASFARLS